MGGRRPKKRPPTPSESVDEAFMFPVGAEVEVRSDDPGFEGSFYEATVAGHLISRSGRGRRYTLAYSTLLAEEGGPLKETAAAADVRPRPPPGENARTGFAICDMVEAFHNEGWWAGVVSAVPPPTVTGDRPRGLYKVTFPTSRETMEFEGTALRPHCVFKDGRWVPAAEVDNGSPLFSEGNQVEVRQSEQNFGRSWSPATVSKVIGAKNFLVQYTHIEKNGELVTEIVDTQYIRPACAITHMDSRHRFSPSSHIEVFHEGDWSPGVIVEVSSSGINKKYVVRLKNHKTDREHVGVLTVENTQLRLPFDWVGKKWVRCLIEIQKPAKGSRLSARKRPICAAKALYGEGDGSCRDKKLKKADAASESISPLLSDRNKEYAINHMSRSYPKETMEQRNVVLALESQLSVLSLPPMTALGHLSPSSLIPSCHLEQSSQMVIEPCTPRGPYLGTRSYWSKIVLTDQEQQSTVGGRTDLLRQKEECGAFQTADARGERTETAKKGIADKTLEEDDDIIAIFEDLGQLPNDMIAECEVLSEMNTGSCIDLTPHKDTRGSQERSGMHDLKQGGYAGETNAEQDTGEDLCQDTSLAALEGDKAMTESLTKEFPGSRQSIEKSPVTRISSLGMSTCTETEAGNSLALVVQHLPFAKSSALWAKLEALEIFSKLPQRPHFQLLQHHCPELCEGIAFGLMYTFALLAESINRLEVQDENGLLEEKMEVLSLLEANGFDVRALKSRLEALLDAKNSRVELQDAMNRLEELIAKKETEGRELSTRIRMLAMALHQLDLHAYLMRDMMRSAISQKMSNAMEISKLKTEANKLERSYLCISAPR